MASIKFGGLVLVVIIISLALKYSSACAQEGIQRKAKWFTSISTENHESNSQNMAKMGGRKVLVGRNMQKGELLKRETEKKGESNLKQEISGNDAASKKSMDGAETSHKNSQDNSNVNQRQERQKEYASKKNIAAYSPPKSTAPVVLSDHDHDHYHHRHKANRHEKDNKNHEFLEGTDDDDVINLMRRDYRGTDRPRRKPPINNHEPSD